MCLFGITRIMSFPWNMDYIRIILWQSNVAGWNIAEWRFRWNIIELNTVFTCFYWENLCKWRFIAGKIFDQNCGFAS